MQVWSGGHDARLCALSGACTSVYEVGALKDGSGGVSQAGGAKAIVCVGWNVWVFGIKSISVYSAQALPQAMQKQV